MSMVMQYILVCIYHMKGNLFPLNDVHKAELSNKYSEVELIIIEEILISSSESFLSNTYIFK